MTNLTILVIIPPNDKSISDGVVASKGTLHARQTIASKEISMAAAHSGTRVFCYPAVVNWNDIYRKIPSDRNTTIFPPISNSPVHIGSGPSVSTNRMGIQKISISSGPIGPVEVRNAQQFHTSINGNYVGHEDPAPTFKN